MIEIPSVPNFYCTKARQSFLNAYGTDDNVLSARTYETHVEVTLRRLDDATILPASIDGVPFHYVEVLEEAS